MKTILVFVMTLDGKVTKWGDPHVFRWSSKEDQVYFKKIWKEKKLFIMGSGTYGFDPMKPNPDYHLVVMTSDPDKWKQYAVEGQIEFTSASPVEIHKRFSDAGHEEMVVVGGPHVAASFLEAKLIDELWLTIEPRIFGAGDLFIPDVKLDVELKLLSSETVNEQGTMITKYKIIK
jgi:dihydrofolate reductase